MSRSVIRPDGVVAFRTKLMQRGQAERFAACLRGNARFCDIDVVTSDRAKSASRYYLTFRPASDVRQADLYMVEWNKRQERGETEGMEYLFVRDRGYWWCLSTSGETYEVSAAGCTCPDFVYKCRRASLHCKHLHALEAQRAAGMLEQAQRIAA